MNNTGVATLTPTEHFNSSKTIDPMKYQSNPGRTATRTLIQTHQLNLCELSSEKQYLHPFHDASLIVNYDNFVFNNQSSHKWTLIAVVIQHNNVTKVIQTMQSPY